MLRVLSARQAFTETASASDAPWEMLLPDAELVTQNLSGRTALVILRAYFKFGEQWGVGGEWYADQSAEDNREHDSAADVMAGCTAILALLKVTGPLQHLPGVTQAEEGGEADYTVALSDYYHAAVLMGQLWHAIEEGWRVPRVRRWIRSTFASLHAEAQRDWTTIITTRENEVQFLPRADTSGALLLEYLAGRFESIGGTLCLFPDCTSPPESPLLRQQPRKRGAPPLYCEAHRAPRFRKAANRAEARRLR